jgi:hypothetical protein
MSERASGKYLYGARPGNANWQHTPLLCVHERRGTWQQQQQQQHLELLFLLPLVPPPLMPLLLPAACRCC